MIQIKLYDKKGNLKVKLSKGKKYTITKDNFSTWEKIEIMEI